MNRWVKWILRIVLSGLALYFIFRKISWHQTRQLLLSSDIAWLIIAFVCYNASQFLSAYRLFYFYRAIDVPLSYLLNLKLYYKGMFYNLFLPGGIGGDGYKVHFLYKAFRSPVKKLITATLMDRVNGLIVLGLLIVLLAGGGELPPGILHFPGWWLIAAYLLLMVLCRWAIVRFFPVYSPVIIITTLLSLSVQVLQLISLIFILYSLHIHGGILAFFLLFLLSSVAAVIPFTIGGAGAREVVFMAGAPLLGVASTHAVAASLLFFLLTALSSLTGVSIHLKR